MRIAERYELAGEMRERYVAAGKRLRGELLDAFCLATGYHRKYAMALLRGRRRRPKPVLRKPRRRRYGPEFRLALALLWEASGYICAERLQPFFSDLVASLMAHSQIHLTSLTQELLLSASVSTVRRNLSTMRDASGWGRPQLRPATRLRREVPVKLRGQKVLDRPGFMEIDLVSHSGRWATGSWLYTLSATDLCTGWSELVPVMTKGQQPVLEAVRRMNRQLPFRLTALHIDNGYEFLNDDLIEFCSASGIELSRGRPHHKNDNPHIEQKNGYLVRRLVSNHRLDNMEQWEWLDELYTSLLRPFNNCFQPVMKRIGQVVVGTRIRRLHDHPRTPLQRLLDSGDAKPEAVPQLVGLYSQLSPLTLKRQIQAHLSRMPAADYSPPGRRWATAANG
jgi:transposase InsO family protein